MRRGPLASRTASSASAATSSSSSRPATTPCAACASSTRMAPRSERAAMRRAASVASSSRRTPPRPSLPSALRRACSSATRRTARSSSPSTWASPSSSGTRCPWRRRWTRCTARTPARAQGSLTAPAARWATRTPLSSLMTAKRLPSTTSAGTWSTTHSSRSGATCRWSRWPRTNARSACACGSAGQASLRRAAPARVRPPSTLCAGGTSGRSRTTRWRL
mmetsp:Transcript_54332/g.126992  ORF Transcript_54332/g.126992 Transcript_54332/m.126992 type:complete len:220 (+) Transcript_54332:52-711(+)